MLNNNFSGTKFWTVFIVVFLIFSYFLVLILLLNLIKGDLIGSVISTIISYLLLLFVFKKYIYEPKPQIYDPKNIPIFFIYLFFSAFLFFVIVLLIFSNLPFLPPSETEIKFFDIISKNHWYGILIVLVIAPIFEELFFRKYILSYLQNAWSPISSIIISSFLFGIFHMNLRQMLYTSVLGMVFGYVYRSTGRVIYSIFMHFSFNFFGLMLPAMFTNISDSNKNNYLLFLFLSMFLIGIFSTFKLFKTLKIRDTRI